MAKYDLRYIQCAKYVNTNGTITFTEKQKVGDAMTANIELRFAEGRLYAESTLAEFVRKCTGGTISLGVKYIKTAAQKLMFGLTEKSRSVTPTGGTATDVTSLVTKRSTLGNYVGVSFYTPALYEGVEKYDCIFIGKCMFGEPSETLQTAQQEFDRLTRQDATFIFVTNEIGWGGVSDNLLQRRFTDLQGWMNQYVATHADKVVLMVSGLAVSVKDN